MTAFHKQCAFLFLATFVVVGVELWILQPWPAGEQKATPSVADQRLLVKVQQVQVHAHHVLQRLGQAKG